MRECTTIYLLFFSVLYFYVYFNGKFGEGMTLDICLFSPPEIWSLNKSVLPLEQNYIIICITYCIRPSMAAQTVKSLPAIQETCVRSLGWEDPLEKGMATHSSFLAWRIPIDRGACWATVHGVSKSQA